MVCVEQILQMEYYSKGYKFLIKNLSPGEPWLSGCVAERLKMNYKKLIVESGVRMADSGLTVSTYGNISCRDPETGHIYLTPSGMRYDLITEDDIVVVDINGNLVEGNRKPTIEYPMHTAIYRSRPEVNAVIHTHAIYSTLFATIAEPIPMIIDEAVQRLRGEVKCTPQHEMPGSDELSDACIEALGKQTMAALLHSHGAVCVGNNMEEAFTTCTALEMTAQIYYMIRVCGATPGGISKEHIAGMQDFILNHYGQGK
jgi:L-fuculose-phosphate aldolase